MFKQVTAIDLPAHGASSKPSTAFRCVAYIMVIHIYIAQCGYRDTVYLLHSLVHIPATGAQYHAVAA